MWAALASVIAGAINVFASFFPAGSDAASQYTGLPHGLTGLPIALTAVFGTFVDLPVLFGAAGAVLTWKVGVWLWFRVWRTVLQMIPFVG